MKIRQLRVAILLLYLVLTANTTHAQPDSLTEGLEAATYEAGIQTSEVTKPLQWRWAERFFGHDEVDSIESTQDGCGARHVFVGANEQGDVIEYLMEFGEDAARTFSRLIIRGWAEQVVNVGIYIDGVLTKTVSIEPNVYDTPWETPRTDDDIRKCNGDTIVELPDVSYGTHAIALKYVGEAPGNLHFDGLLVCPPAQHSVDVHMGEDIQPLVDCNPGDTVFLIKSGVHRNQEIVPKKDNKFIGEDGARLNGSVLLTGWEPTGISNIWKKTVSIRPNLHPTHGKDACRDQHLCYRPEDLFVDDRILRHVAVDDYQVLEAGQWSLEYPENYDEEVHNEVNTATVYLYSEDNPSNHTIELSTYRFAFGRPHQERHEDNKFWISPESPVLAESHVTIEGFVIEKYANLYQHGAIGNQYPGDYWTIKDNDVTKNHSVGIRFGGQATVANNHVFSNGQLGMAGSGVRLRDEDSFIRTRPGNTDPNNKDYWEEAAYSCNYFASNSKVTNNEIDHNRLEPVGFKVWHEGGATKFACTRNLLVQDNYVHSNSGHGLWADIANECVVYDNNRVENNGDIGIFHELSNSGTITNNIVRNNGIDPEDLEGHWNANIQVTSSEGVSTGACDYGMRDAITVEQNRIEVNASGGSGIILNRDEKRKEYWLKDVNVLDNVIVYKGLENEITYVNEENILFQGEIPVKSLTGAFAGEDDNWSTYVFGDQSAEDVKGNTYLVPKAYDDKQSTLWEWLYDGRAKPVTWQRFSRLTDDPGLPTNTDTVQTPISLNKAEKSLQGIFGILDTLYGLNSLERVDDGADQTWVSLKGESRAKAVAGISGNVDSMTPRDFGVIFPNDKLGVILGYPVMNEAALPGEDVLPVFRWGIGPTFPLAEPIYSSDPRDNSDQEDHMVSWVITDGPSRGNHVLAWEDFNDFDFNDLVVEVSNVAPLKQTPILPAARPEPDLLIGMEGVLDDLCGFENLMRISDDDDHYWENKGNGTATARGRYSGDPSQTLEYIDRKNKRHAVFTESGDGADVSSSGTLPLVQELPTFRWGLERVFSSKPSDNADLSDHMVTWEIIGGGSSDGCEVGNFLIAWDDRELSASDQDYQDMVVEVSGVAPLAQVNDQVAIPPEGVETDYLPNDSRAPAGVFIITATFTNNSDTAIYNPFFGVFGLSGENTLLNADGGPGAVGVTLTPNVGSDRVLSPDESITVMFKLGLREAKPFTFFVDLFEGVSP